MLPSLTIEQVAETAVYDGTVPGLDVVGDLIPAILEQEPELPEDLDGDGVVGAGDLAVVLVSWGAGGGPADIDGNGIVDSEDLARYECIVTSSVVCERKRRPAAIPTKASAGPKPRSSRSLRPASARSSSPSELRNRAGAPPASTPCTSSGGEQKVGGHSAASSTPRRPEVPAPR
jgi:hypothetical protein